MSPRTAKAEAKESAAMPQMPGAQPSAAEPKYEKAIATEIYNPSGGIITGGPIFKFKSLKCGCYLVNYTPKVGNLLTYDGTLRIECDSSRTTSGDLYQRSIFYFPKPSQIIGQPPKTIPILLPGPNPASGIPIFSIKSYRYYLRVTDILEGVTTGNSFSLGFEMYRFTAPNSWASEGVFTASMSWKTAPTGYPSSSSYLEGDVKNSAGTVVGRLTMGWVSKYLRKATIEIDRVSVSEAPLNNSSGIDWKVVGDSIDWELTVDLSDSNVVEPSGESWSDAELHKAMLLKRDSSNLDATWIYHILAVRRLDSTERGLMYDIGATDSNNVPREGIGISSHWMIPKTSEWGTVQGMRFGTAAAPYFRTAVHEIGHAMGLYHNTIDNGFMNTTDVISASCPKTFPACIKWAYADNDKKKLRHYPDIFVRPGGTAFGTASNATPSISPTDMAAEVSGLELYVTPLLKSIPLGAPVRIKLELFNSGSEPQIAPVSLNLDSGLVKGSVIDPSGNEKTFRPLIRCVDRSPEGILDPGKSVLSSLTLLRGGQGALFSASGVHRIIVEIHWDIGGVEARVAGETSVIVTAPIDDDHARAALDVLSTPDSLLTLVLHGDHMADGVEAIQSALRNPVLRPHFAYIEARRLAERFEGRQPDFAAAANLIDETAVMTPSEINRAAQLLAKGKASKSAPGKEIADTIKSKAKVLDVSDALQSILDSL
ncbi:MAG: hypothetical protein NTU95_12185 [Methanothrix sp.]|nr:hypothetical protein [Methanothrix sp.]